jgi:hypothetical protein
LEGVKGLYQLNPPCTSSVISVQYIVLAENVHSGKLVWERDPGPKDLDNRFFFNFSSHQDRGRIPVPSPGDLHQPVGTKCSNQPVTWMKTGRGPMLILTPGVRLCNRLLSLSMPLQIPKAGPRASVLLAGSSIKEANYVCQKNMYERL